MGILSSIIKPGSFGDGLNAGKCLSTWLVYLFIFSPRDAFLNCEVRDLCGADTWGSSEWLDLSFKVMALGRHMGKYEYGLRAVEGLSVRHWIQPIHQAFTVQGLQAVSRIIWLVALSLQCMRSGQEAERQLFLPHVLVRPSLAAWRENARWSW